MKHDAFMLPDPSYMDRMRRYSLRDTAIALAYYALIMFVYSIMGTVLAETGLYLGVPVSIVLMLIPVLLCRRDLADAGLDTGKIRQAAVAGGIVGLGFLLSFTIIPGILVHMNLLPAGKIMLNVLYYFIIIGLSEEISFRGFIQPRLFPVFRCEWLVIAAGGMLFVLMHYPFQMTARHMTVAEYWPQFIANAPMQFVWHLVFTWLYRKYGNIFGSAVLHGCVDMSMGIFG